VPGREQCSSRPHHRSVRKLEISPDEPLDPIERVLVLIVPQMVWVVSISSGG
jgi:hypothetical protein